MPNHECGAKKILHRSRCEWTLECLLAPHHRESHRGAVGDIIFMWPLTEEEKEVAIKSRIGEFS